VTKSLSLVFFVSGAAALLFETLWFRQAGIALGNTIWATSLVTASFMGGLAIGNGLAARFGRSAKSPLLVFVVLELMVGISGLGLVLAFPVITAALAPVLGSVTDEPARNAMRIGIAFTLLLAPSSAMGATLPLLTRALSEADSNFGRVLGRLYGWNTLGAVAGALLGELIFIESLGIRGTALLAAGMDFLAAGTAFLLCRTVVGSSVSQAIVQPVISRKGLRIVAAAFIAGGLLLALEIVWFRLLLHFIPATSLTFAIMLAVVLAGIGTGGLTGAAWMSRHPNGYKYVRWVALASTCAVVGTYSLLSAVLEAHGATLITSPQTILSLAMTLMLAVSIFSGLIFTLLGQALHSEVGENARAAGILTLANTLGGMLGALAGGFVLLPYLGLEWSIFLLALGYLVVAAVVPGIPAAGVPAAGIPASGKLRFIPWAPAVAVLALFPFGLMSNSFMQLMVDRWSEDGSRLIAADEGLNETVMIFQRDFFDVPVAHRLVTNSTGMAATGKSANRYMGLYVWLPVAIHPHPRSALLISYGLGTTARALTETRTLESIDVVDISADVLRLGTVIHETESDPLDDPRVDIHIEDGRFFLLTSQDRYDIITAEPPPPKSAGVGNLYSEEYFELIRSRLTEGGIATYWLPVYQMAPHEARAIVKAFCNVFRTCSLWSGSGFEWMLVGVRGNHPSVTEARFAAQWQDPVVGERLRASGLEDPAQLGTLFLADATTLLPLLAGDLPLTDDFPYRLSPHMLFQEDYSWYLQLMDVDASRDRFAQSDLVEGLWPRAWRERTLASFTVHGLINRLLLNQSQFDSRQALAELDFLLSKTDLETAVLWRLGTDIAERDIAEDKLAQGGGALVLTEVAALGALARRDYQVAERQLGLVEAHSGHASFIRRLRILALGRAGDAVNARRLFAEARIMYPGEDESWSYLAEKLQ
jgi:spermidine synthase